ncbi:MAG: hypothetical protein M0R03_21840 [Novosphingobium sp.]|nr:hypothetical protein [Novosphingobium sp.]
MAKDIRQRKHVSSFRNTTQSVTFGIATVANDMKNVDKENKEDTCCEVLRFEILSLKKKLLEYQTMIEKNKPNGYVGLGSDSKIFVDFLPETVLLSTTMYDSYLL